MRKSKKNEHPYAYTYTRIRNYVTGGAIIIIIIIVIIKDTNLYDDDDDDHPQSQ